MRASRARDVFINCAFDDSFLPFFHAIVFTIVRSGFRARCAQETDDGAQNRFAKIQEIVEQCRYGIHDISRTESDGDPPLPRFNMPLELGLFLGARRYGDKEQKKKRALILDREKYRYQRFMSDIAGQDIHSHDGEPENVVKEVATWLREQSRSNVPGGTALVQEFRAFKEELPRILAVQQLSADEVTFGDFTAIVVAYLTRTAAGQAIS